MSRPLITRLAKLEVARSGPAKFVLYLPHDAWDHGDAALEEATAAASRRHTELTGYSGPVLVSPEPCSDEEEWVRRYG